MRWYTFASEKSEGKQMRRLIVALDSLSHSYTSRMELPTIIFHVFFCLLISKRRIRQKCSEIKRTSTAEWSEKNKKSLEGSNGFSFQIEQLIVACWISSFCCGGAVWKASIKSRGEKSFQQFTEQLLQQNNLTGERARRPSLAIGTTSATWRRQAHDVLLCRKWTSEEKKLRFDCKPIANDFGALWAKTFSADQRTIWLHFPNLSESCLGLQKWFLAWNVVYSTVFKLLKSAVGEKYSPH